MSPAWKARVLAALAANAVAGRAPKSVRELARMIRADKAGILRALSDGQHASKYVRPICVLLGIDEPMVENPSVTDDEWNRTVGEIRDLPPDRQRLALQVLKTFVKRLDSE